MLTLKNNIESKFRNPLLLIVIGILLGVIFGALLLYLVFGNLFDAFDRMKELKGQPSKTYSAMSSLSYVITWILSIYSIIVTAVFSYMVWKINEKSLNISEELKNIEQTSDRENRILTERSLSISEELKRIEENREFENKREKALIVYYDLQRGFSIILNLYLKFNIKDPKIILEKVYFSENWIENVASLRKELNNKDIQDLYYIYNALYTIQNYLEDAVESDKFVEYLEKIAREFFVDFLPLELLKYLRESNVDELLSVEKYLLLHKLYKLTFNSTEITKIDEKVFISDVNHYEIISGDYYNGEGIIYNSSGNEKLRGYIVNGVFATGTYTGWNSTVSKLFQINYETISDTRLIQHAFLTNNIIKPFSDPLIKATYYNGKPFEGRTIKMHSNGNIAFWGEISNGEINGEGKFFDQKELLKFEGKCINSQRINGKLYNKGKLIFEGQFNEGLPWNGKVYNKDFNSLYVKKFTGVISEGKPVEGQGYIFKRSSEFSSIQEMQDYEHAQEQWDAQYEEISYSEEYEEEQNKWQNENIRKSYSEWEDFILAEWNNGSHSEAEDKESNINVYYYPHSKRK